MQILGLARLKRSAKRAAALFRPRVAILMYHRVHNAVADPWDLSVSPANFNEQMEYLRRHCNVLSLGQVAERMAAGRLPRRAVVLTFDDGYVDNLVAAKPILERWNLPATFFVVTGNIGHARGYWWDELTRLFLEPGRLPEKLDAAPDGEFPAWDLGDAALYSGEDCRRHRAWRAIAKDDPTPRHALVRALNERLYRQPDVEKRHALDRLFAWANASPDARPSDRTLTPEELVAVEDGGLVDIGAHSVTHPVLPALSAAAQENEIRSCKSRLEAILGHPVSSFCYPHGAYSAETVALVKSAAFATACTVECRLLDPDADPLQLPRIQARDWDGDEFGRQLQACMAPG